MKPIRRRAGFTLAELLIVVAIVAVLAAIAIPVFAGGRERASATQCLANRTMIEHAIRTEQMLSDHFDAKPPAGIVDKILKAAAGDGGGYFAGPCKCNEDGAYSYDYESGKVVCSVKTHQGESGDSDGGGGEKPQYAEYVDVYMNMSDIIKEAARDREAFKKKYGITNNNLTNSIFREIMLKEVYNGEWPKISDQLQKASGVESTLYVQPFYTDKTDQEGNLIVYAANNQTGDNWNANLIGRYDKGTGVIEWYKKANGRATGLVGEFKNLGGWAAIQKGIDDGSYVKAEA